MPSTVTVPVGLKPNITVMTISVNARFPTTHPNGPGTPTRQDAPDVEPPVPQGVAVEGP